MQSKLRLSAGFSVVCTLLLLTLASVQPLQGHDPKPVLRSIYAAPLAVITIYQVKPGSQDEFVNAMVSSGPYNRVLYGFANERILQAVSSPKEGAVSFISFARYYDKATADFVDAQRNPAISSFLQENPLRLDATLIEHELADWGWEKGTDQAVLHVRPLENEEIFQRNVTSLSFFKSGYTGQVGFLEVLPSGIQLADIRASLSLRRGLSGASVFSTTSGVLVYSEYFKTPTGAAAQKLIESASGLAGGQAAVVVQNYVAR
jgi:hypothetical protein